VATLWLVAAVGVSAAGQGQAQPPGPVSAEVRARFSVVVTADQTVTARVYEYLELLAKRNISLGRFGTKTRAAELELVLLFEEQPKLPWNRRDIGTVNLRINPIDEYAAVEYCLSRCLEPDADLVVYRQSLDAFLQKLDEASAVLARRWGG
jgi:hypothetical protein